MAEEEKSHQPTDRRIQKAREEGRVATSRELLAAITLGVSMLSLFYFLPAAGRGVQEMLSYSVRQATRGDLGIPEALELLDLCLRSVGLPVVAILATGTATALLTGLVVTGFNYTVQAIEPKWDRFDLIQNAQNAFFSRQPWVQLLKGLLICLLLLWAVWTTVEDRLNSIMVLSSRGLEGQAQFIKALMASVLQRAVPVAIGIGFLDLLYQRWHLEQQLMMSTQEIKDEQKESEGDPQVRSKRKQRQRQLAMRQSVGSVAKADVLVTNPTHYAIALRYRKEENASPVIVARGTDEVALKLRQEAMRHDIVVIENRPLARALYAKAIVGAAIPREFYAPVAEVLAVVFRKRRAAQLAAQPQQPRPAARQIQRPAQRPQARAASAPLPAPLPAPAPAPALAPSEHPTES